MVRFRGGFGADEHPEDATLHAWMKGELAETEGAGVSAHLSACEPCKDRIASLEPIVEGLEELGASDLDDLSWQRIAQAVKRELETPKRPSLAPATPFWGQRWVSGVLVTAAVVALFVWGSPPLRMGPREADGPPGAELVSAERGYSVRLPSGVELGLAPDTRVRLGRSEAASSLFLETGQVELLVPESIDLPAGGFEVRAPAFRVSARSGHLRVGYWAREYFVEVEKGEAKLRPEGQSELITIHERERRTVHLMSGPSAARVPERRLTDLPAPAAAPSENVAVADQKARKSDTPTPAPPPKSAEHGPAEETHVEVIPPPPDPIREKLLEANRAFYEARDVARAVSLAEEIATTDAPRPEVRLAHALLCEAHLALGQPERAVSACEAQLRREPDPQAMQEIHLKLGSIFRTMLARCPDAIRHYSETIVFGRVSLMDTEARLGRAECALEVGDLALAERDLDLLSTAPGLHAVKVEELINRMDSLRKSKKSEMDDRDE